MSKTIYKSLNSFCSFAFDHHPRCSNFATAIRRHAPQAKPSKGIISGIVWARKTGMLTVVEPPPTSMAHCTIMVHVVVIVVVVEGWEVHSIKKNICPQGSVGERISSISTVPWEVKGVFVAFRINGKGIVISVVPLVACIELYLRNKSAKTHPRSVYAHL